MKQQFVCLLLLLTGFMLAVACAEPSVPRVTDEPPPTAIVSATSAVVVEATATPQPTEEVVISAEIATLPPIQPAEDPILTLDAGWTQISPGGETRCAHDTEFSFWAKPGTTNKLLVYFQGGGGCWDGDTCQIGSSFYDASVGAGDSPAQRGGILDFDNPENPFADYHAVYVPSCTGDIYLGDNVETYETSVGEDIDIYHRGFVNLNSALEWAYEHVLAPESVFVTGCSAGSIGSIRAAPHLLQQYADAEVAQLGDSLGFLFSEPTSIDQIYGSHHTFPEWISAFADFDPEHFTMADFYNTVAAAYPEQRFAQYNTEGDRVQLRYHLAGGDSAETFPAAIANAISNIHAASPNFNSYTADGDVHCILPGNGFYSRTVSGVRLRDWVAELAAHQAVDNVQCDTCNVSDEADADAGSAEWEQIGTMPTPRSENRGVVLNERFYIPGGWGGETVFESYDPLNDSWQVLADLPEGRHHFMVATLGDKIYLFGGSPPNAYRPTDSAWVYDSSSDSWDTIAVMPSPRLAGAAVTLDDAIYIVGGSAGGGATPTLRYDPSSDSWQEFALLNQPGEHVAAVGHDGKIYVFGGWERAGSEFTRMEIYDVANDTWTNGGSMRIKRGGLAAAVLNEQIYVVGGELLSSGETVNGVEVHEIATGEWSDAPSLPASIHGFPLLSYDNALWVVGGSDQAGDELNEGRVMRFQPKP